MQLNVKDASVQEVLRLIAEEGDFNLAIGDGIKGRVTLYMNDIAPRALLDVVVGVINAAYSEENGAVWIMTKEAYSSRFGEEFVDNLKTRTFALHEANVKDILPSVRDLLGKTAEVKPDIAGNMIRVKANARLLMEAEQLIQALDSPKVTKSFPLTSVPAPVAREYLERLMGGRATFVEDAINQRVMVNAAQFDLERAAEIIGMLDMGEGAQSVTVPILYAQPDSLAERLRPHLTPDFGQIYSDAKARKLVIVDFPAVASTVADLAAEFDIPLRQVLIEARIIQVSTSREIRSGIDWSALEEQINVTGKFPVLGEGGDGLRGDFGNLSSKNYQVVVEALETFGDTDLLSSPRLMVTDGSTGLIHVGSQVPYKTITTRETASGVISNFEEVVVVDVGIKLEVEATIHGQDMVYLRVKPEVSSVTGFSENIPVIDASTVDSGLMVEDGNTIILGGLIKDESRKTRKGIPLLSRVPLIKYLVSSNVEEELKSELIILLTPKIMTGRETYEEGKY